MALEVWKMHAIYPWIEHMYDATRTWDSITNMLKDLVLTTRNITRAEDGVIIQSESCRCTVPGKENQSLLLAHDAHSVVASNKDGKMGQNHPCFPEYLEI